MEGWTTASFRCPCSDVAAPANHSFWVELVGFCERPKLLLNYACEIIESDDEISILSFGIKGPGWFAIIFKQTILEGGRSIAFFNESDGTICNYDDDVDNIDGDLNDKWNMQFDLSTKTFYYFHSESLATQWEKPKRGSLDENVIAGEI